MHYRQQFKEIVQRRACLKHPRRYPDKYKTPCSIQKQLDVPREYLKGFCNLPVVSCRYVAPLRKPWPDVTVRTRSSPSPRIIVDERSRSNGSIPALYMHGFWRCSLLSVSLYAVVCLSVCEDVGILPSTDMPRAFSLAERPVLVTARFASASSFWSFACGWPSGDPSGTPLFRLLGEFCVLLSSGAISESPFSLSEMEAALVRFLIFEPEDVEIVGIRNEAASSADSASCSWLSATTIMSILVRSNDGGYELT